MFYLKLLQKLYTYYLLLHYGAGYSPFQIRNSGYTVCTICTWYTTGILYRMYYTVQYVQYVVFFVFPLQMLNNDTAQKPNGFGL